MSRIFVLPALLGLALLPGAVKAGPTAVPADAVKAAPNQFYGPWIDDHKTYWHREYYFKVRPTDAEFQKHEVVFYKKGPRFFYYYSPESGQFWGRGCYDCRGNEQYQFLQPDERAGNLKDVNFDSKPVGVPPRLGAVTPPAGGKGVTPPVGPPGAGTPGAGTPPGGTPKLLDLPPDNKGAPPVSNQATAANGAAAKVGPQLKLPPDEPAPQSPFGG